MIKEEVGGIVLVGGRSKRMGRDKYALPWRGVTLIEYIVGELQKITSEVILICREPIELSGLVSHTYEDMHATPSALTGLYSGLMRSGFDYNFVLACDVPFFSATVGSLIMKSCGTSFQAAVPRTEKGFETLYGVYSKECVSFIEGMFLQQDYAINKLLGSVTTQAIDGMALMSNVHEHIFFNVNTPGDYARALEIEKSGE